MLHPEKGFGYRADYKTFPSDNKVEKYQGIVNILSWINSDKRDSPGFFCLQLANVT